jgi:hypothetical protein
MLYIDDDVEADLGNTSRLPPAPSAVRKRKVESASTSCFSSSFPESMRPANSNGNPSKCYPKSLSVLDMMKLEKIVDSRKTTVVHMYSFDIDLMTWSKVDLMTCRKNLRQFSVWHRVATATWPYIFNWGCVLLPNKRAWSPLIFSRVTNH